MRPPMLMRMRRSHGDSRMGIWGPRRGLFALLVGAQRDVCACNVCAGARARTGAGAYARACPGAPTRRQLCCLALPTVSRTVKPMASGHDDDVARLLGDAPPPWTPAEEREAGQRLLRARRRRDVHAVKRIEAEFVTRNLRLVAHYAHRLNPHGLPLADLVQEGA